MGSETTYDEELGGWVVTLPPGPRCARCGHPAAPMQYEPFCAESYNGEDRRTLTLCQCEFAHGGCDFDRRDWVAWQKTVAEIIVGLGIPEIMNSDEDLIVGVAEGPWLPVERATNDE